MVCMHAETKCSKLQGARCSSVQLAQCPALNLEHFYSLAARWAIVRWATSGPPTPSTNPSCIQCSELWWILTLPEKCEFHRKWILLSPSRCMEKFKAKLRDGNLQKRQKMIDWSSSEAAWCWRICLLWERKTLDGEKLKFAKRRKMIDIFFVDIINI